MTIVPMHGLRVVGFVAMALAIAHCGDSDVHINTGVDPSPGTFIGTTDAGERIEIEVGSIESITFDCNGETISESFDPSVPIVGGRFELVFTDGGRGFVVEGRFTSENNVEGSINDEDDECDTDFAATRDGGSVIRTPTPSRTPTNQPTSPTETPTNGTPTLTPTATNPTETMTVTATPSDEPFQALQTYQ